LQENTFNLDLLHVGTGLRKNHYFSIDYSEDVSKIIAVMVDISKRMHTNLVKCR